MSRRRSPSQIGNPLSKREQINAGSPADHRSTDGTVEGTVTVVGVKNVDLQQEIQRSIVHQAEAERERRTKVTHTEGEFEAFQRLADAADVIGLSRRVATPLSPDTRRYRGGKITTIFPSSIDTITSFLKGLALK